MASLDIFNPSQGFDRGLGFNANPNYGGPRKIGANYATVRPRFGPWWSRSVGDAGSTFAMTFVDRPIQQVRYIQRFYHQFQTGFFTFIDWDDHGREYVGRFTSYSDDTHTANLKYTVNVTFEELPGAPMRNYPSDFEAQGHWLYVVDDFLNPTVAVSGGPWVSQQTPLAVAQGNLTTDPSSYEFFDATGSAGDWAQAEYFGFGFQMCFRLGAALGICGVQLDGVQIVNSLDLSTGAATSVAGAGAVYLLPSGFCQVSATSVSLGRHRVKVLATGLKNAAATATSVVFPSLQVIHG